MKKGFASISIVIMAVIFIAGIFTGCSDIAFMRSSDKDQKAKSKSGFNFPIEGVRPYAVMIDNQGSKCLPQGGLNKAQIIYEVLAEGGITRFMAVFWNTDPTLIGPVRSSRHYFLDYAMENDAIYVHFGWSPQAESDIVSFNVNNINGISNGWDVFWDITSDKGNWQDSYTSMEKLEAFTKKAGYSTTTPKKLVFSYNVENIDLTQGLHAGQIDIIYNSNYNCGFHYDSVKKEYKRLRMGVPQMERVSGKQLRAKNIIIQTEKNNTISGDAKGRQELGNVGEGSGWFITCGNAIKITWSKASRSEATEYFDENGDSIMLNPGQTWIQIVPPEGIITIN